MQKDLLSSQRFKIYIFCLIISELERKRKESVDTATLGVAHQMAGQRDPLGDAEAGLSLQQSGRLSSSGHSDSPKALSNRSHSSRHREACTTIIHSWLSRKFVIGVAILFPVAVTFYVTWWFIAVFDNFFSPLYHSLFGFRVFGLGFLTSMLFILGVGIFFSSWLGTALLNLGEWIIKRLPLVRHIYSASKQVSAALNPDNDSAAKAFQECVLIRHPRHGEYAFAFITGKTTLQAANTEMNLITVYVPTNHVYVGDIFLLEEKDIIRTNLSVREGLEVVISVGMAIPQALSANKL